VKAELAETKGARTPRSLLERLGDVATIGICLAGIALAVHAYTVPQVGQQRRYPITTPEERVLLKAGPSVVGPPTAQLTITEFADYQCPFCASLRGVLQAAVDRYPGRVRVVFRNYPIARHQYATPAAIAAECARDQGQFLAYHDLLFASQATLATTSWDSLAAVVKVPDLAEFRACVVQERTKSRVLEDRKLGDRVQITSTPTLFLNGIFYRRGIDTAAVIEAIGDALKGQNVVGVRADGLSP
jgi:protein-disulfide isomerase